MLDFCVAAFAATMASPGSPSGHPSSSRQPKLLGVSSETSFTANVSAKEDGYSESLRIGKLKGGAWCCVYPFSIDTPLPGGIGAGRSANSALSFEIRAACSGVDDSLQVSYVDQPIGRNALSGRSAHLEELATRVSSAVFAHGRSTAGQSRLLANPEPERLGAASNEPNLAPEMPRRMFQALVLTKPIANVDSRVTDLPPSLGANARLVTVSVQCDVIAARNLALRAIVIQSPEWHVQLLPAQPSLPFALTSGSRWQSIYKLSPLAKSPKEDALRRLGLLNISAAAAESTGDMDDPIVYITIEATGSDEENGIAQTFRAAHRVAQSRQSPPTSAGNAPTVPTPDNRQPLAAFNKVHPSTRPERSSSIAYRQAAHLSVDQKSSLLVSDSFPGGVRHSMLEPSARPLAIGGGATAFQPAHIASEPNLAQSGRYKARAASMLKIPARSRRSSSIFGPDRPLTSPIRVHHVPPAVYERGMLSEQRARSGTIDALSMASQSQPRPSISASTVRSESTSGGLVATTSELRAGRAFSSASAASLREPDVGMLLGTIGLSFEAPPKASLGDRIAVQVHISNNTSILYARLCLVDGDSEFGLDDEEHSDSSMADHGLLSLSHITAIPTLRPGESTSVVLHYVAAAPHFHAARPVRLIDQEAGSSVGQVLATFVSPFIVYVDDGDGEGDGDKGGYAAES
ncbi:hypothetical protein GGI00_003218 [Coemansia sp. RSA 2681]|nr:hypothetical protein GGI00_003218 [Coemansia sp. RSA 2681]